MKQYLPLWLLASLTLAMTSGCNLISSSFDPLTNRTYRSDTSTIGEEDSTITRLQSHGNHPITLGFLEFDDQGELWRNSDDPKLTGKVGWTPGSRTQLPDVLKELRRQVSKEQAVQTVIFIHGWNNNAAPGNENLENFKKSLQQVSAVSKFPIFGVFVGWRGKVAPFSSFVDVGSREATAARVGGPSLLTSLRAIRAVSDRNDKSRVIAVGHSFGAKILSQVAYDDLAVQLGTMIGKGGTKDKPRSFADSIILVNTAETGTRSLQLMNLMRDNEFEYKHDSNGRNVPLVVSISSSGDRATHYLLPIWNNVARHGLGLPHKSGAASNKVQDRSLTRSMGFFDPLRSHQVGNDMPSGALKSDEDASWKQLLKENLKLGRIYSPNTALHVAFSKDGNPATFGHYTIDRVGKKESDRHAYGAAENETPVWFIQVPGSVSKGHSEIWNPNFTGLVVALEAMKYPEEIPGKLAPASKPDFFVSPQR